MATLDTTHPTGISDLDIWLANVQVIDDRDHPFRALRAWDEIDRWDWEAEVSLTAREANYWTPNGAIGGAEVLAYVERWYGTSAMEQAEEWLHALARWGWVRVA